MSVYAAKRVLGLIPVLFGISVLIFTVNRVIPADPALVMLGERATPEARAELRQRMGLDDPLFFNLNGVKATGSLLSLFDSQYFHYAGGILRGDLGKSYFTRSDVTANLLKRFPATLELTLTAMFFALLVGIPAGVLSALHRGSVLDTIITFIAVSGVSIPVFWLAIILINTFAVNLGWLPSTGRLDLITGLDLKPLTGLYVLDGLLRGKPHIALSALEHLVLPGLTLGTIPTVIVVRMTRSAMLEALAQDYVRTATAKGLSHAKVVIKHALRNALPPVVTVIGLSFGSLLSGAILTETIFAWPGIGRWAYDAITARDYPIVQGTVLLVAFVFVVVNLLVDLSYALIDPRIQYS